MKLDNFTIKTQLNIKNNNKFLANFRYSTNYLIFDEIFDKYFINDKNNFFYFYQNKLLLNFLFKLSNKNRLKLKSNNYVYLYNNNVLLHNNYYTFLYCYNWKNIFNLNFYR